MTTSPASPVGPGDYFARLAAGLQRCAAGLAGLNRLSPERVAIHLDLDAVDSDEVVLGLGAEPGGLTSTQVRRLIADIHGAADVVGIPIAEYVPRQVMALQRLMQDLPLL
jgi:arginase